MPHTLKKDVYAAQTPDLSGADANTPTELYFAHRLWFGSYRVPAPLIISPSTPDRR